MLKKLKLLKKPLFQKRRWSCDFPPRKTLVAQKHRAISRQEKMAFSTPVGFSWDFPPPPTESVWTDGRTDVRTDVRTDGHVTITSEPKFLGLIVYQISLAMELRWRALPAGSAKNLLTRLNKRANLCKLQSYKHVAINFKLPNKAVSTTLQSTVKIIRIKHRYNLFNQHLPKDT